MVATWKTQMVEDLAKRIKGHRVVGVVRISGIPSKQMQTIRKKLEGKASLIITRGTLIQRALEKAKIKGMEEYLSQPVGLILSDLNPFQLEKLAYGCRTNAAAKQGNRAPFDIYAEEGDTGLPAGPMIGDLQGAGIKAKIQGGKISVIQRSLIANEGEKISDAKATAMARLGIEPMEIMLKINAAYEDGTVYTYDMLHISEEETVGKIQNAHRSAFNLAYNAGIFMPETIGLLLGQASAKARNLMINAGIINKETIGLYLGRADAQARALKAIVPEELMAGKQEGDGSQPTDDEAGEPVDEKG
jgi:large subunit ribosomal protein L10